jgi:class I fructose-bisphosphate aldolase
MVLRPPPEGEPQAAAKGLAALYDQGESCDHMGGSDVRLTLDDLDLDVGRRTRLHRLLYQHGPGSGTLMLMPIDQGLEHGPRDFFDNPAAKDPETVLELTYEAGFSGIVFHVGLAEKYLGRWAGKIPLILKLNGKTEIPSDKAAFSGPTGSVEDALRLGADAVGYTLYVGSPSQDRDFAQFERIRAEAHRYGLPVIVWSYPRGEAIEQKGGRDSFYAVDYAARVACELGADVIKLNVPATDPERRSACPKPYDQLDLPLEEMLRQVIASAGRSFVIFAGGTKGDAAAVVEKARQCMRAGATGLIFGRNVWQRPRAEALELSRQLREAILSEAQREV